ncbi:MAG TPA: fructose-bisphosphate aldolase [Marinilabiliales bacterium]|jgi:fructose-bisphosphate aldolase class II|nr:MAG: fructose-bisphosphate aldolase [Bacteroidetes bacterium GWA2_40_14]OFX57431.1 MAG: fructose-bisphosphate aldolase [Bacteroidetes bacterium GWC2_40_13]OFX72439.1 MAG: fructose-bisphosphate aldolase [Bacteroidetes bacterium GWD2_40_43]OFX95284.1 MAG: fructose-bisphosphate aldolase [Bacteroidetes bacterium GWE2_40_63]OFY21836.1 MAG: fructose-bisphosphate aldolase [Bacteroidetes bacterium GWF2_40_13]OFZ26153.1 MAG: fructose-bisphosphate aldolase [Bacteroidetes bacterium RIFOXYC2_FULL_40_12
MLLSTNQIFKQAYQHYGIAAFNVFNAEQVWAVFSGASKCNMPVIIQITPAARNYLSSEVLIQCIKATETKFPKVDYSIHLDHGNLEHCYNAIHSGHYKSVMIDASHETFSENVRITREVVNLAHQKGIAVEAELGILSGIEDHLDIDSGSARYTDPDQAKEFVKLTQCDSLAIAVGTSHGAYKFIGAQGLQLGILTKIHQQLPGFPLVLHGASSVPYAEIERINRAGGLLKESAKGIQKKELLQAIKLGVCKINIATDIRLLWTRVHREFFKETPELFDMVVPGKKFMSELESFVVEKCTGLIINEL